MVVRACTCDLGPRSPGLVAWGREGPSWVGTRRRPHRRWRVESPVIASMAWSGCLVPETETEPGLLAEIRKQMGAVPEWISRVAPGCSRPWREGPRRGGARRAL